MRVAVVGGGLYGLSAARALLARGHEVELVDRAPLPNPRAASVDAHRFIRHAYGAERGYTLMVDDAYRAWEALWAELGERLGVDTGTLLAADMPGAPEIEDTVRTLGDLGRPFERLRAADLRERFPVYTAAGVADALLVPTGGILFADAIVAALARLVEARGCSLRTGVEVTAVDWDRAVLELSDGGRIEADCLVVAPGAWVTRLVPDLAARLRPARQTIVYFDTPEGEGERWRGMPVWFAVGRRIGIHVAPPLAGRPMKIGDHAFGPPGDPDGAREVPLEAAQALVDEARRVLTDADRFRPNHARTQFYTVADDECFIVQRRGAGWLLSCCSGHGFKFGPAVAERLADAIEERTSEADLARWAAGGA